MPASSAAPPRENDGFDEYVHSTEVNRDRWRRKQHALDRARERETTVVDDVTLDGEDADEVPSNSDVDREWELVPD
jgi:hypothetical protein